MRSPFGWSEVAPRSQGPDVTELCEPAFPDFSTLVPGVDVTLRVFLEQERVHQALGLPVVACTFRDRVLVSGDSLDHRRFMLHRHAQPRRGNSGWYVGPVEPDQIGRDVDYEQVPSGRLLHRGLVPFLTLPEGSLVLFEQGRAVEVRKPDGTCQPAPRPFYLPTKPPRPCRQPGTTFPRSPGP